jgi:hypothetical protein
MAEKNDTFYVGYLPLPGGLRGTIAALLGVLFALVAFDAWLVATLQPQAGNGNWAETPTEFVGTLVRDPYPMLRVNKNGKTKTYIVISDEKRGAEAVLEKFANGASIKLEGYEIERAAVGMIQLATTAISTSDAAPVADPSRELHGRATVEGEIVDSKCWLGVMRPGDGHIHKACASLCIRGGIPPMLVTRDEGVPSVMLLTLFDGRAIPPDQILEFVAYPVRLSGIVEKRGDLTVFKADLATLTRHH